MNIDSDTTPEKDVSSKNGKDEPIEIQLNFTDEILTPINLKTTFFNLRKSSVYEDSVRL